jgi:hypothetical protein
MRQNRTDEFSHEEIFLFSVCAYIVVRDRIQVSNSPVC